MPKIAPVTDATPLTISVGEPEWDIAFAPVLERLLEPTYTHPYVILDMGSVRFIDSTCLGKLIKMHKERQLRGFDAARLVIPSESIRRVFALVRFDELFPIYESLSEAMAN
jgi:anti-anti-sigma factor